jgi:hypothetical protein
MRVILLSVFAGLLVVLLGGCSEFGRPLEESKALKIAEKALAEGTSAEAALQQIAVVCAPKPGTGVRVEGKWIRAIAKIDPDLHGKLFDKHSEQKGLARDIEAYRRQLARQAICMIYGGKPLGLEGVRLVQPLMVNLASEQMVLHDASFRTDKVAAVADWNKAKLDNHRREVFDAVFKTAEIHEDNTSELTIITIPSR